MSSNIQRTVRLSLITCSMIYLLKYWSFSISRTLHCSDSRLLALPVVLIFGVATTVDAVHRSLPHVVTASLTIRKFTSTPSIKLLAQLVRTVTMDPDIPFTLGGETMKSLLETFMFHDFSVKHFLTSFKVSTPYLFLCNALHVDSNQIRRRLSLMKTF